MKNTLLYYQGGGYSGCIWEWNFCFWDMDGIWHDLYSSGYDGITTEVAALELAETLDLKAELVDLTDTTRFEQFQKDNNAQLVLSIAQELNDNYGYSLELTCAKCGCKFNADRSESDAAIDDCDIICCECLTCGTCDCCNEYVGPDKINCCNENSDDDVGADLAEAGYYSVCNGCFEYNEEEMRLKKLKNLRFKAFCTGKPDIFSNELREIWE